MQAASSIGASQNTTRRHTQLRIGKQIFVYSYCSNMLRFI